MSEHVNDCDCCQRKLAALRIAGTIDGIHLRQRDAYRDVLRDLIAELRHRHTPYRVCMECDDWYAGCEDHEHITVCLWCCTSHGYHSMDCADNHTGATLAEHCVTVGMADRAEADLRELWKRGQS